MEFCNKHAGILSAYALIGIAAVKRNSQRILSKFNSGMDGAFLLNRAFLLHNEEAFLELPALLADEFVAAVEDVCDGMGSMKAVVKDAVTSLKLTTPDRAWTNDKGQGVDFSGIAKEFLTGGATTLKDHKACKQVKDLLDKSGGFRNPTSSIIRDLAKSVDSNRTRSNEQLAALFNVRSFYAKTGRPLTFGTVVRRNKPEGQGNEYSICLVPACDSLRLPQGRKASFPFCILDSTGFKDRKGRGFVIADDAGSFFELIAAAKPRDLWVGSIVPTTEKGAVEAHLENNGFWFDLGTEPKLEWVAQLKPVHAQRIAHDLGQAMTRIGLAEAEWVRLLCDRP